MQRANALANFSPQPQHLLRQHCALAVNPRPLLLQRLRLSFLVKYRAPRLPHAFGCVPLLSLQFLFLPDQLLQQHTVALGLRSKLLYLLLVPVFVVE